MEVIVKFNQFMQGATPYILAIYLLLMLPLAGLAIKESRKRKAYKSKFIVAIDRLLSSDCNEISYKSVLRVGKGFGLKDFQIHSAMEGIYSSLAGDDKASKIEGVLDDIGKIDPYKALPEDLKPALIQVEKQIEEVNNESSKLLIQPLKSHFVKYSELLEERDDLKKKSLRNTQITVVSAIVGVFGLAGTLTSPSVSDIEVLLKKNLTVQEGATKDESNESIQPTADATVD